MNRPTSWSLRGHLYLLVLAALLPALALILLSGLEHLVHEAQDARERNRQLARSLAAQQRELTEGLRLMLETLALLPEARNLDAAAMTRLFQRQLQEHPAYGNILMTATDGTVLSSAVPAFRAVNLADRKQFQAAMASRRFSSGEYVVGRHLPVPVLPFAAPAPGPDGLPRAVLMTAFRVDVYKDFLDRTGIPAGTRVDFLDARGTRLFGFPEDPAQPVGQPAPKALWSALTRSGLDEGILEEPVASGGLHDTAFHRLRLPAEQAPYLTLAVSAPRSLALQRASSLAWRAFFLLAGAAFLAMGITRVLSRPFIVRGVEALTAASRRLGQGDFATRVEPVRSCRELEELARRYDEMAALMEAREIRRVRTEREMEESRTRLREALSWKEAILDTSSAGFVVVTGNRIILEANPRAAEMYGYTLREFIGLPVENLHISEESSQRFVEKIYTLNPQRPMLELEYPMRRKDGTPFWCELSGAAIDPLDLSQGVVWVVFDITGRKAAEESLRRSQERLELALVGADLAAWNLDLRTGEITATPQLARMAGYSPEEAGPDLAFWDSLLHPEDLARVHALRQEHLQGKTPMYEAEYRLKTRDGQWKWTLVRGRVVERDVDGSPLRMSGTQLDIDYRRRMEAELVHARIVAEQANQAKSEFLANMSHEIRTPLNGVVGALHLLGISPLDDSQKEYVETALASGQVLLSVINEILDFSKIEAGKVELIRMEFAPADLLNSLAAAFGSQAQSRGISLLQELDPALPPILAGDEGRLRQIMFNLLGNALKFTRQGTVRMSLALAPSRPTDPAGTLRLAGAVADTGMGIPAEKLETIFDPFTQADGTYSRRHQGTGLGLSIVKRLAMLLGGSVSIASEPGQGTVVSFEVLMEQVEGLTLPGPVPAGAEPPAPAPGLRLLLAEDDGINRLTMTRILEMEGHHVTAVASGLQALEALGQERYDCVLMDVQMPGMDGLEATRLIRDRVDPRVDPAVPIIAFTAHAVRGDRERFLEAGMNEYLSKPVDMVQLRACLAALVRPASSS